MMTVNYGRNEGAVMVQADGPLITEVKPVVEAKVDARSTLWAELDKAQIPYKKNMSKAKLEELLE